MVYIKVDGFEKPLRVHDTLYKNLEKVKHSVIKRGWDYVAIVSGLPGAGKSTFAHQICKSLDPTFNEDRICFTAKDFREKTSFGNKGEAYMLDESFADMNANLSRDPEFIATVNHLQLIRQRNLFLILVLPDFFSLQKTIAIFRSSHLFVVYATDYDRGSFAVFDRGTKRELYIKGKQFLNYQIIPPNFRGNFSDEWFINFDKYEKEKLKHLQEQATVREKETKHSIQRDFFVAFINKEYNMPIMDIVRRFNLPEATVRRWVNRGIKRLEEFESSQSASKTINLSPSSSKKKMKEEKKEKEIKEENIERNFNLEL
jgi:adenylate kinase family enzyme